MMYVQRSLAGTARTQRSDIDTSLSINCGKTPHDHHITKIRAGLVTWDMSKISDLCRIRNVYFFSSFPVALIAGTSSFHFAQPELSSMDTASWTQHVHPKVSAFLCTQDLSEYQ